jgi:hypothetical protein
MTAMPLLSQTGCRLDPHGAREQHVVFEVYMAAQIAFEAREFGHAHRVGRTPSAGAEYPAVSILDHADGGLMGHVQVGDAPSTMTHVYAK